jgi:hypothetical protein
VTDTAWEHQREVREALQTTVSDPQLGIPALSNAQAMSNLLKDLLPDAPREYPYSRDSRIPIYLWTLPTQRVILIANDQAAGATYTSLGHWWSHLSYG